VSKWIGSPNRSGRSRPWVKPGGAGSAAVESAGEFHHRPLVEPSVTLSRHSAPIRQTHRSYQAANGRKDALHGVLRYHRPLCMPYRVGKLGCSVAMCIDEEEKE
jgi:hypothetical protein